MKALIVVDMQYDFIDGTLPVKGAWELVPLIQEQAFNHDGPVVFTACAHPSNHCSFKEYGGEWPAHCIAGTRGASLQVGLLAMVRHYGWPLILKGADVRKEEYSGFDNPKLNEHLQHRDVTQIEICGLARDYCVAATAGAAAGYGYEVTILERLTRSVK